MNDPARKELMIVVERAVRPVRASVYHKRRMREELLEHLSAVFDNEMDLQDDIQTGLERAKRRFGDPAKLTAELQQTVPWWDRVRYLISIMRLEPGESTKHFFAKHVVFTLVIYAATLLIVLPVMMLGGENGRNPHYAARHTDNKYLCGIAPFLFVCMATRIGLALHGEERQRSKWVAACCMIATGFVFPALFFCVFLAMSGDLGWSLARLPLACYLAPAFPLLFLAISRQAADEIRHEAEWGKSKSK